MPALFDSVQRNSCEKNRQIKQGKQSEGWDENKQCQKDIDARWTKKNGKSYYVYKNHISVDVKHKLIRRVRVINAQVHDTSV